MSDAFDISQIQNIIDHGIPHCADIGVKVHDMNADGVTFSLPYQERFAGNPVNGVLHGFLQEQELRLGLHLKGLGDLE